VYLASNYLTRIYVSFFSLAPPSLSLPVNINPGDVLEVQGPPASGKTYLVYHFLASCVLPVTFGGWGKAAILFDPDASFDVFQFKKILSSRLAPRIGIESLQEIVDHSTCKLHGFHPNSTIGLAVGILYLPHYHTGCLPDSEIGMIAVDSLSAFYWSDRFSAENARFRNSRVAFTSPLQQVMTALEAFRLTHGASIVLSTWSLFSHKNPDTMPPIQHASFITAATGSPASLTHLIKLSVHDLPEYGVNDSALELDCFELLSNQDLCGDIYTSDDRVSSTPFKLSIIRESIS